MNLGSNLTIGKNTLQRGLFKDCESGNFDP